MLLQAKGWTAIVVVSLALGIGANTALFSAVNGMLLTKLPVHGSRHARAAEVGGPQRHDARIRAITASRARTPVWAGHPQHRSHFAMYQQFVADNRTMTDLFACAPFGRVNVVVNGTGGDRRQRSSRPATTTECSACTAMRGRIILPEDDQPAAPPVAVVSERYWRIALRRAIRRSSAKSCRSTTCPSPSSASSPPEFTGVPGAVSRGCPTSRCPLLSTAAATLRRRLHGVHGTRLGQPTSWWLQVMGRLKPGATVATGAGESGNRVSAHRPAPGSIPTSRRCRTPERGELAEP